MTPEQWAQARSLYETVSEQAVEAQPAYLQTHCADSEVQAAVAQMLADRGRLSDFLETPLLPPPAEHEDEMNEAVGRRIGAYVLKRELGRGGMGVVYLAARADDAYQKEVAIKLLWPGWPEDQKRFRRERQILAALDHPGIARLLDGQVTTEGWQYIVMEYVAGLPITEYCEQHELPLTERIELMVKVCEAVEYAHQQRVIHRDLKPANILVTADGTPRLLDFGIAKLLDVEFPLSQSLQTQTSLRAMTPDYASPEQMRGAEVTAASDVYSLGVLLYELLTGQRPFQLETKPLHEAVRIVSEDDPVRPSVVVTTRRYRDRKIGGEGERGRGGEKGNSVDGISLSPNLSISPSPNLSISPSQLRGDLDNIVLMALRKDPMARYQSVTALREDLERHLQHQPVSAREPTLRYRASRFVRRHRFGVTIAALLLLGGTMGLAIAWQRAQVAWRLAYLTQMQQAARQLEEGGFAEVRATLEQWRPAAGAEDLRGFEWFYLWREAHRERMELRHDDWVLALAFAPDGTKLVSAGQDRVVNVWDTNTGQSVFIFKGHTTMVVNVAVAPDNRWVASASDVDGVRVWDITTGQERWRADLVGVNEYTALAFAPDGATLAVVVQNSLTMLRAANGERLFAVNLEMPLQSVAFFPDSRRLVTGGHDDMLRVWDAATGKQLKAVRAHPGSFVFTVAVSPDGRWIASGGNDPAGNGKAARVWKAETLQEYKVFAGHTNAVRGVAFSPDSTKLVTASADQKVKLWDIASGRELRTWRGHTNRIRAVAFAPDGRSIASCSDDNTVKVWNVDPAAEPAALLVGHTDRIIPIAISSDGQTIATGSRDATVKLSDANTGRERHTLRGHWGEITSVAFAPDGRRLLTGNTDGTFRLWDTASGQLVSLHENHHIGGPAIAFLPDGQAVFGRSMNGAYRLIDVLTGRELKALQGHTRPVIVGDFSPDGKWLLTRSEDATARVWEVATGREIRRFETPLPYPQNTVSCDVLSPDGRKVFLWQATGVVQSWDVVTGRARRAFRKDGERLRPLCLSADGQTLATLSTSQALRLWDTATGKEIAALDCPTCGPFARFSPDGKWLAVAASDDLVRLWDVAARREVHPLRGQAQELLCFEWSPDSRRIATGGTGSVAKLWDAMTKQQLRTYPFKTHIGSVLFSPDSSRLLAGGNDAVGMWEVETGKMLAAYDYAVDVGQGPVRVATFSPDGRRIATTTSARTTALWNAYTGHLLHVFRSESFDSAWSTRFSPDGQKLVTASWDKTVRIWDIANGRELVQFTGHQNPVTAAVFSPDGKFVASGGDDRKIRLWEAATGHEVRIFTGHTDAVRGVAFSPDGRRLASASVDKTVRVWDVASGLELLTLRGHTDEVWGIAFAPDGRTLVSGSWDKTVRLWRAASEAEVLARQPAK